MYSFKPFVFTEHIYTDMISLNDYEPDRVMYCDGKNLYIFLVKGRKIYQLNLLSKQWKLMKKNNYLSDHNYLVIGTTYENNCIVVGCMGVSFYNSSTIMLHYYDLDSENCKTLNTYGHKPVSTFPINLLRIDKYFYTVGASRDDDYFCDVYRLNTDTKLWEIFYVCNGSDAHEPMCHANNTLVHLNGIIYIFGSEEPISLEKIPAFDLENCLWKTINLIGDDSKSPNFPVDRWGASFTQYTDPLTKNLKVILAGGAQNADIEFNDIWELNLSTLTWTCLEKFGITLPHPTYSAAMCVSPSGQLFKYGGQTDDKNDQISIDSKVYSAWLIIPKLTDICWDAVSYYFPDLATKTKEEIKSIGIPWTLIESRMNK